MNAGTSTLLLQAAHTYREGGMHTCLIPAQFDRRAGEGRIASRIGIAEPADTFAPGEDMFAKLKSRFAQEKIACVFIDEAQFLSKDQVWQLARAVDDLNVPVMCYGLRVDFQGNLFPGSAALLAGADEMREVRTICHCGKKATMVIGRGPDGRAMQQGEPVQIGGNETYVSLCRRHWRAAMAVGKPLRLHGKSAQAAALARSAIITPAATIRPMPTTAKGRRLSPQITQLHRAEAGRMAYSNTETRVASAT